MSQAVLSQPEGTPPEITPRPPLKRYRKGIMIGRRTLGETIIELLLLAAGLSCILITTGIVVSLCYETGKFFRMYGRLSLIASGDIAQFRQARDAAAPGSKEAADAEAAIAALEAEETRLEDLVRRFDGDGTAGFDTASLERHGPRLWVFPERADYDQAKVALRTAGFAIDEDQSRRSRVTIGEFLTGTTWTPGFRSRRFGILALISGTLVTTGVALLVAIPAGTMIAIYLSEYAPHALREGLKPVLELLSAVPTVVYGYFALLFVTPLLQKLLPGLPLFNMLSAGLVMGVMIIPYVSSLSEDAMHAVPMAMREGSYAMGATRMQTALKVIFPSAFSGITAAYILGISRAIGETMVVAVAAGQEPRFTFNPQEGASTITAYIVQVSKGDLPHASIEYQTIFAAGLTLLLMTLLFNIGGYLLRKRYREAY